MWAHKSENKRLFREKNISEFGTLSTDTLPRGGDNRMTYRDRIIFPLSLPKKRSGIYRTHGKDPQWAVDGIPSQEPFVGVVKQVQEVAVLTGLWAAWLGRAERDTPWRHACKKMYRVFFRGRVTSLHHFGPPSSIQGETSQNSRPKNHPAGGWMFTTALQS